MPLHRYRCGDCKYEFEEIQKFSDEPLYSCPSCGGALDRLRGRVNFALKGEGWAGDGYASAQPESAKAEAPASVDDTNFEDVCKRTRKEILRRDLGYEGKD